MNRMRITEVGEYVRYQGCDRRFKLKYNNYAETKNLPDRLYQSIFQTSLDPILEETGRLREQQWAESLIEANLNSLSHNITDINPRSTSWYDFTENLAELRQGESGFGREIEISGKIGNFHLKGQIDFVLLLWEGNKPKLRLVETKASRKDRTYHRIQIALYLKLVRQQIATNPIFVDATPIKPEQIEGVVVRIDGHTNQLQNILAVEPFNFDTFEGDINYLLAPSGKLEQILATDLDKLDYQLNAKCSDCLLSVHCLSESARGRRLELLGIDSGTVKSLAEVGITTLDHLIELDLKGEVVRQLRGKIGFTENLDQLQIKAQARRYTLLGDEKEYPVKLLPSAKGQKTLLPARKIEDIPLLRIFISVEYDYIENRIVALSAHLTNSDWKLDTKFEGKPIPVVQESLKTEQGYQERPLQGRDIIETQPVAWEGNYQKDTEAEKRLITDFFRKLSNSLINVATRQNNPIHFYFWSKQEITQLIEGCTRCGSELLANLQELLGCRRELEQQIYTCLDQEVDRCFALGWTGRDLVIVTSLPWFGAKYHWCRQVEGETVFLDRKGAFWRDIFDFVQYGWKINSQGDWDEVSDSSQYPLEIRLRYFNSISAAYWRGYWGSLPDQDFDTKKQKAIADYRQGGKPGYLKEFILARTHALRWIEERFPDSLLNPDISKPLVDLSQLEYFTLRVNSITRACLDFLRLDHYVRKTDWITSLFNPPIYRLSAGNTLLLKNVELTANQGLIADIDWAKYDVSAEIVETNCSFEGGSFVRVSPCFEDPHLGQSFNQLTSGVGFNCIVKSIDWEGGKVILDINKAHPNYYVLPSARNNKSGLVFDYATIDENPSDFVAQKVDKRLGQNNHHFINYWLDPVNPQIPPLGVLPNTEMEVYQEYLERLRIKGYPLHFQQKRAIAWRLNSRIQLLLGPPGTGKTNTTAIAIFLRIVARYQPGDVILISASTHTAVNELISRLAQYLPILCQAMGKKKVPEIILSKCDKKQEIPGVISFDSYSDRFQNKTLINPNLISYCKSHE
ncbi:AAA domain-containing protein [Gloeocapsa sp. PCC 73106]|uniref:AAA domain-containing protein n=1 Tax=Gloeocapsa sp. PCC 73106 TaxID=102232 RepID=UPI00130DDA05|nr:AAA domain-containing protein [Gloeocapsa sp. PCC 73106]